MIARRRIIDVTEQIAGGLAPALSAVRTGAATAASRLPQPGAQLAAAALLTAVLVPAAAQAAAPGSATPPVPVLHWRSCYGGFQCATARVPLSYRDPRGATISIAVVRHLATDPARRIGTLFVNIGGPGAQVGPVVAGFGGFPAAIAARYDIITFDPRRFRYNTAGSSATPRAHDATADEARDMLLLRQAVGARVLNYMGLSYGTGLGATYAN